MSDEDEKLGLFEGHIVNLANENTARLDGTMQAVEDILAENELVFAVWQDRTKDTGISYIIIKGHAIARDALAKQADGFAKVSAIACPDADVAFRLQDAYGDQAEGVQ
jgi:hypothetical protein